MTSGSPLKGYAMNTNVALRQLAVRRDEPAEATKVRRSWRLGTRIVLPGMVLLGFLAVVGWAARDRFLPAREVTIMPVVTTRLDIQSEGTPIFQAAGWMEPRPTPILVTALAEGVVEGLVRVSVGIEDWRDLLADFEQALDAV